MAMEHQHLYEVNQLYIDHVQEQTVQLPEGLLLSTDSFFRPSGMVDRNGTSST